MNFALILFKINLLFNNFITFFEFDYFWTWDFVLQIYDMPLKVCTFNMVPIEFYDGAKKSFHLSADESLKHFIVADFMIVIAVVTEFLQLQVRVLDGRHEKLEYGHALLQGHEWDFGTDSDDFVF